MIREDREMSTFVFGSGFRGREPEASPRSAAVAPKPRQEWLWMLLVPDYIVMGNLEHRVSRDREVLASWARARGYEVSDGFLFRVPVWTEATVESPRELCIRRLDLSWRDWPNGRGYGRDPLLVLSRAGHRTLGQVADAGVDRLRELKMPARLIRLIGKRLAHHGLELRPSSEVPASSR